MSDTYKLLVADDDENIYLMIRNIIGSLDTEGITVEHAPDGKAALDKISQQNYFLVFLDFNMPVMNGLECLCELQKQAIMCPPIIFLSAKSNDDDVVINSYQHGAIDYLAKPINHTILLAKSQAFLNLYKQRNLLERSINRLQQERHQQESLLNYTDEGIIGFSKEGDITYANMAASTLLSSSRESLLGQPLSVIVHPQLSKREWLNSDFMQRFINTENQHDNDAILHGNNGLEFEAKYSASSILDGGDIIGGVFIFQDVSEENLTRNRLTELACYDQLTSLINRSTFNEYIKQAADESEIDAFILLVINIKNFKSVNESLGPNLGDKLLQSVANRVSEMQLAGDMIARVGADEFAWFIPRTLVKDAIREKVEQIIEALTLPHFLEGKHIVAGVSIGIAVYPENGSDVDTLLSAADTALYMAKESSELNYAFFDTDAQNILKKNYEIGLYLRRANFDREFKLYYQPKFQLASKKIAGAEALLRWESPVLGEIPPSVFIPIAENIGCINEITRWALNTSSTDSDLWNQRSLSKVPVSVAVNASAIDLLHTGFANDVLEIIYARKLNPAWLEIELTETALMQDPIRSIQELNLLHQHNIKLAIDDFGTGYSSLSYLKNLPISYLKIDRSFIHDIGVNQDSEKIIMAIIHLAHSFDLKVIAEGIETTEQLAFLEERQCDIGQGYLFSKPLPRDAFESLLTDQENSRPLQVGL